MRLECILLAIVGLANSYLQMYLLHSSSGDALSYIGTRFNFSDQSFGDKSQLWRFTQSGDLIHMGTGECLNYNVDDLVLKPTSPGLSWSWENGNIRESGSDKCIDTVGNKVVSCDKAANITLMLHDETLNLLLHNLTQELDNSTTFLNSSMSDVSRETSIVSTMLVDSANNLSDWTNTMTSQVKNFTAEGKVLDNKIILTEGHLDEHINKLEDALKDVKSKVDEVTSKIHTATLNFTQLKGALQRYQNDTNATIKDTVATLQAELDKKASNGHIIPDNIYEFTVLFLLALGIVNVVHISVRLIRYAINQPVSSSVVYGNE